MISSELTEVLNLARRIVVMREGFLTGELSYEQFSQEHLLNLMA
jgi:ABC-type sugar transport system ATPase subunit